MTPQLYIEFETKLQAAQFDEWVGREYVRDAAHAPWGNTYPLPPDEWDNTVPPWDPGNPPPPESFTWFYTSSVPTLGNGAVHVLYDDEVRFATQEQTLSNGLSYSFDITGNAKTFERLSPQAQAAVTPPT